MAKVRVYEIAKDSAISNKDLVAKIRALGIEVANHMSTLDPEDAARIQHSLERERQESLEERQVAGTVIRRRSKAGRRRPAAPAPEGVVPGVSAAPVPSPATTPEVSPEPAQQAPAPLDDVVEEQAPGADSAGDEAALVPEPPAVVEPPPVVATEDERPRVTVREPIDVSPRLPMPPLAPPEVPISRESPRAQSQPQAEPASPPEGQDAGEEKLGPTGRFIDLKKAAIPRVVITDMGQKPGAPRGRREYFPSHDRRGTPGRFPAQETRGKGKRKAVKRTAAMKTEITTPAEHKRRIRMDDAISTGDLARQMGIKATDVLKKLWGLGMTGITINSTLDFETAGILAGEFGFEVENVAFQEQDFLTVVSDTDGEMELRPPVITIMGHVDHGKTSLLDAIRHSDIVAGEAGGITQHIGAYKVSTEQGEVVFIDTPGHEAFSAMRARGATCTDLVVLVVAADDGVMPQTREAIQHAQAAKVPIIVAVNKIDKADANPERIKQDLTAYNLVPEDWGGDTIFCEVSAITKQGIPQLLEMISFQAEMLELRASPDKLARGVVLESQLDKARGPVATVVVQDGTLRTGDIIVTGEHVARVRALVDDRGRTIKEAPPSTPVQVLGLSGIPEAGELFNGVKDEKAAKLVAGHRQEQRRRREGTSAGPGTSLLERLARGEQKELKVVLKADQMGTAEAVREALAKLTTEKVELMVVQTSVGAINESDVNLAKASGAMVVGFHVRPTKQARDLAERESVEIKLYNIIYEMLDDVKDAMRGLLPKERTEKVVGHIEVRNTFTIPRLGTIAGCFVLDGRVHRNSLLRVFRNHVQVYVGKISSLRRFKDDVREVEKGYECGLGVENFNDIKVDDQIEVYEIEEHVAEL